MISYGHSELGLYLLGLAFVPTTNRSDLGHGRCLQGYHRAVLHICGPIVVQPCCRKHLRRVHHAHGSFASPLRRHATPPRLGAAGGALRDLCLLG